MRSLDTFKHSSNEYAILLLYFFNKDKKENYAITKITRKVYLVDNLKTNMLIENNLIDFKRININVASKSTFINSCDVTISIKVKTSRVVVYTSMHVRKTIIVSFRSKIIVSIYYNSILSDRDFLFELDELNLLLYAYLVNAKSRTILIRNDSNMAMQLSRNYCVNRITKLNFSNAF